MHDILAVDTETTGFSWYDEAFLMTIAGDWGSAHFELPEQTDLARAELLGARLVFHNAKFDLCKLINAGILDRDELVPTRIEDTEACASLLWPHSEKRLKVLAKNVLGLETNEAEAIKRAKLEYQKAYKKEHGVAIKSKDIGYDKLPREVVIPYALKDAEFTWLLYQELKPRLKDELLALYEREMELTLVLLDIEANGLRVDLPYVDREVRRLNGKILSCELRMGDETGLKVWYPEKSGQKTPEGCFNPNSGSQLAEWFGEQGIELANTQKATLAALEHPLAETVSELRKHKKLLDTYLMNMKNDQRDGIIHPNYAQHRPKTGRMSSRASDGD